MATKETNLNATITVNVNMVGGSSDLSKKIDQILKNLTALTQLEEKEMALIDDVLLEAQRGTTVGQSVIALVQKLVDASGGDPVKLQAALAAMKANDDAVEAAVVANTPAAPTP